MAKKQSRLPGTEDHRIKKLEDLAEEYVSVRDERQSALRSEIEIKGKLLAEMHGLGKARYETEDIFIEIKSQDEKLKVKLKKSRDEEQGDEEQDEEES